MAHPVINSMFQLYVPRISFNTAAKIPIIRLYQNKRLISFRIYQIYLHCQEKKLNFYSILMRIFQKALEKSNKM